MSGHPTSQMATLFLFLTEQIINFNYYYRALDEGCSIYIRYLQLAFSTGVLTILVILTQSIMIASVEVSFVDLENGRVSLLSCAVLIGEKDSLKKDRRELFLTAE